MLVIAAVVDVIEDDLAVHVFGAQTAVIDFESAIVANHAHHIAVDGAERHVVVEMIRKDPFNQLERALAPGDDLIDILEQIIPFVPAD